MNKYSLNALRRKWHGKKKKKYGNEFTTTELSISLGNLRKAQKISPGYYAWQIVAKQFVPCLDEHFLVLISQRMRNQAR